MGRLQLAALLRGSGAGNGSQDLSLLDDLAKAGADAFHHAGEPWNHMRGEVFVELDLTGQQKCRLDVGSGCCIHRDRGSLDLGVCQFNLAFFLAHHEHEALGGRLRDDLDLKCMGFGNDFLTDQAVFFLNESQLLLFVCQAGHRCGDRRGIQRQRLVLVEQPDTQPRLSTILGQQRLQAEIAFLENGTAVRALGSALFVALAVRMALVIVVALFSCLAVVLTVAMSLGLGMAAVPVAIALSGCGFWLAAALQDKCSRPDSQCEDDGNGDQVLFTDGGFTGIHGHSQFCVAIRREAVVPPSRRSTSAAARCASPSALRYWALAVK